MNGFISKSLFITIFHLILAFEYILGCYNLQFQKLHSLQS
jgi:hypothetical protein